MLNRIVAVSSIAVFLGGCAGTLPASIAGGECKIFSPPDYAIRGKTQIDQNWIDDTEEAGIAGCQWLRPKARPVARVATISKARHPVPTAKPVPRQQGGHILLPTPRTNEDETGVGAVAPPVSSPALPVEPAKPSALQRLKDRIRVLNEKVKKLEGR